MMPTNVQNAIRSAWSKQLLAAQKNAKTPEEKVYFKALMNAHYGNNNLDYIDTPDGPESVAYNKALSEMHYSHPNSKSSMIMADPPEDVDFDALMDQDAYDEFLETL